MKKVRVAVAWNDLSARGHGKRVVSKIIHNDRAYWPSECPIAEDVTMAPPKLSGVSYGRASDRHAVQYATLPVGTLVVQYHMNVQSYQASRATLHLYEVTEEGLAKSNMGKLTRLSSGDVLRMAEKTITL